MFKIRNTVILLIAFLTFDSKNAGAHHIIGGELYYTNLGNNVYQVTLILYRDCSTGVDFDSLAEIGIFDSQNRFAASLVINDYKYTKYDNNSLGPCEVVPPSVCVDQAVYQANIKLPPIPGGYLLEWQRCCRNDTVVNINDPGETGATWVSLIPDTSLAIVNSSPRFTNYPPIIICNDKPLVVDQSATDPDGDSLSYSLITPLAGADTSDPIPTPVPPPYDSIVWANGYSRLNQLGGNPRMTIDPKTGMLIAHPSKQGRFVVGIIVYEFRNKKRIGFTFRDFAFNVTNCSPKVVPSYSSNDMRHDTTLLCGSTTVNFTNTSTNKIKGVPVYHWDFGVNGITDDTSNQTNPNYTYPQVIGTYIVTLIANPGELCSDTAYGIVLIRPPATKPDAGAGGIINAGDSIQLHGSATDNYYWQPSTGLNSTTILNPEASPLATTTYELVDSANDGCLAIDSVLIEVTHNHYFFVPNAFTPNNDGRNDYFTFYTKGISKILKFEIFNRWGQMLFHSASAVPGWNGTYEGNTVPPGSYVYLIQAMAYDNTVVTKTGDVIIIE